MLKGRHVIQPDDLSVAEIEEICALAEQIIVDPNSFKDVCRGKILAALFFEPSTRTRLSFEAAMLRLGGAVEGFADASYTSTTKGEILADTIRVVSSYADVIAMRSPKEGAALLASKYSDCPIINAGDGGHFHPTQTLTDLLSSLFDASDVPLSRKQVHLCKPKGACRSRVHDRRHPKARGRSVRMRRANGRRD